MSEMISYWQQEIENYLLTRIEEIPNISTRLKEAMLYASSSGGKRIRPLLVLLISHLEKVELQKVLPVAASLEMIHTYSLIHDDLPGMDNDDYRRGKLTVHKQFDEATAILAGDALLTLAFEELSQCQLSDAKKVRAIQVLGSASGASGMITGQMRDIASEHQEITLEKLKQIHADKTGQLLLAAIRLGLLVLDDETPYEEALLKFGVHFGLAFQIQNDLQDVCWDSEKTGKITGQDAALEKNTYPSILGIDGAKLALEQEINQAKQAILSIPNETTVQRQVQEIFMKILSYVEI